MFEDFRDLLRAFNAHRVRYLIVGGYAVSLHAQPRATKDLDILIGADPENGRAVFAALRQFGAPLEGLEARDLTDVESFFRMGTPPVMVDIMARISGIDFGLAWQRRVEVSIDDALTATFISREDLLAAKIAAGRPQDLADAAALQETRLLDAQAQPDSPDQIKDVVGELDAIRERAREEWLKLRGAAGGRETAEETRSRAREKWSERYGRPAAAPRRDPAPPQQPHDRSPGFDEDGDT